MLKMKSCVVLCIMSALHLALSDISTPHQCLPAPSQKCFTVIVGQQLNWNEAEKYCERNLPNGRLASIHNAFEGAIISSWLPFLSTDPWIGAFQVGTLPFQWSDATALDYSNWARGEPTSSCAQICHSSASSDGQCQQGKWRTTDCESYFNQFICEYGNISNPVTTPSPPTVVQRYCNSGNDKCFALVAGSLEWTEAEKFCATQIQNGTVASLASIASQADADIIGTKI